MGFLELAADRYSVRSFSDRPIEQEKMDKILEAAQARTFNLPRHIKPVCLLPVGYPSAESTPYALWHNSYRSIEEMVEEI